MPWTRTCSAPGGTVCGILMRPPQADLLRFGRPASRPGLEDYETMSDSSWRRLMTVLDVLSAQAIVERLMSEGVPARVRTDSSLLGTARRCEILVPDGLFERAEWLLSSGQFSDDELASLAIGEPGGDGGEDS